MDKVVTSEQVATALTEYSIQCLSDIARFIHRKDLSVEEIFSLLKTVYCLALDCDEKAGEMGKWIRW